MDYYEILGVRRDANGEEIKQAFRKLALKFHPDRHSQSSAAQQQGAGARFREVSEAYEVLSDARKRAAYNNRHGRVGFQSGDKETRSRWRADGTAFRGRYGSGYGSEDGQSRHGGGYGSEYGRSGYGSGNGYRYSSRWGDGGRQFYWRWNFTFRPLSRVDMLFNTVLTGVLMFGFIFADTLGKYAWEEINAGKSFEDVLRARQCAKERELAAEKESVTWDEPRSKSDGTRK